jgi:hypothetical protein
MTSFEFLIKDNFEILKTLFHINENNLVVLDDKKRIIVKDIYMSRIYESLPMIKELLDEIFKDLLIIKTEIKEVFNKDNNEFIYTVKFNNSKINNYKAFIKLTLKDKNKINVSINYINKNEDSNIIDNIIINVIINYYKSEFLEKDLKKLINNLNHDSFELFIE